MTSRRTLFALQAWSAARARLPVEAPMQHQGFSGDAGSERKHRKGLFAGRVDVLRTRIESGKGKANGEKMDKG